MNHDLFYLFKRREGTKRNKQENIHCLAQVLFVRNNIMNGAYANHENGLSEVRSIIQQKNADDLTKLLNNHEEISKLISSLNEVGDQQGEKTCGRYLVDDV